MVVSESPFISYQFVLAWVSWIERYDGRTAAEHYLAERGWSLSTGAREWIEAQIATPLSIWEVLSVDGASLRLRDPFTGEERTIHDVGLSRADVDKEYLLARIVDHRGISVAAGVHPNPLRPLDAGTVIDRVRKTLRRKTDVPRERLLDVKIATKLLTEWTQALAAMTQLPPLVNEDGDPILLTIELWTFAPDTREIVRAQLLTIDGAVEEDDEAIAIVRDADAIVAGGMRVTDSSIEAVTNSLARADAVRAMIEDVCGPLVTRGLRAHIDPASNLEDEVPPKEPEAVQEEREILLAYKDQYYATWLDTPIPALDGQTPRAAAETAEGRRKLEVLLDEFEVVEGTQPEGTRIDLAAMRRELGI